MYVCEQINIDWVGILIERITSQTLGTYFAENIFTPLGIDSSDATFFPSSDTQKNLAQMNQRDPDGTLKPREHLFAGPFSQTTQEQQDKFIQSGGGGLFAKPKEYVKILGAVLNDGVDPNGGKRILEKKSVDLLWENQIPDQYVSFFSHISPYSLPFPVSHFQFPIPIPLPFTNFPSPYSILFASP